MFSGSDGHGVKDAQIRMRTSESIYTGFTVRFINVTVACLHT